MRSLALADAFRAAGEAVRFVSAQLSEALEKKVLDRGFAFHRIQGETGSDKDLDQTCSLVQAEKPRLLVLDGYQFGPSFQRRLQVMAPLLVIDDLGDAPFYHADFLLNHNSYASPEIYLNKIPGDCELLLGSAFALIRDEFFGHRAHRRISPAVRELLVMFGGSDPFRQTVRVAKLLSELPKRFERIHWVVGAMNLDREELEVQCNSMNALGGDWFLSVDPPDLPEMMSRADLAISAGGSSVWEFCYLGTPVLCTAVVDNQVQIVRDVEKRGAGLSFAFDPSSPVDLMKVLDRAEDQQARSRLSASGMNLIDGQGTQRVVETVLRG